MLRGNTSKMYRPKTRGVQTPPLSARALCSGGNAHDTTPLSVGPKRPILPYFTTPLGVGMVGAKSAKNRHVTQDTTPPNVQAGVLAPADGRAERLR